MTSSCCWCERAAITSFPTTKSKIKPVRVSGGGAQRTRVERTWRTCRQQSWAWSSRVITGSMFPRPPANASRRCLTTPTSAHWTSCSEVWPSGLCRSKLWNNRNDPTLPSPQTAGSSGSREAAEGKELGSCAQVHLTRWAKAQQQIYEVDVYNSTR